ncbi:MAG: SAM-dependent DNA methyltransferase [Anaerolineae bacterium]|nr:SAM-dependent DNA methyltransferase [Anaerolineae bacterium]
MSDLSTVEANRIEMQSRLDLAKSQAERNKLGQFATPPDLAADILDYARSLFSPETPVRFLDPAIGTGAFYAALLRAFPASQIAEVVGYEIDPHYGQQTAALWSDTPLRLHITDFTQASSPDAHKATLLICNPPYVRHHHLDSAEKQRLQAQVWRAAGVRLSGLAGLYCYFLCIAHEWMADGGLAGWLIPSEFMDVNYGEAVKEYLLSAVTLLHIHRFDPDDVQFDDALVSSAVVWLRNEAPPPDHTVKFTYGGTLAQPRITRHIPVSRLRAARKWTQLTSDSAPASQTHLRLTDLFTIKRGVATGTNKFFILTPAQIDALQLPMECFTPILPSPRYLNADEIHADDQGNPILDRKLFLLTCDLPPDTIEARYPTLWGYLQSGVAAGIHERYLCRHRTPWYAQESRLPARLLCTYMGRRTEGSKPFRFILNRSKAIAANVYLMLYPKPFIAGLLDDDPALARSIWETLNAIDPEMLTGNGRTYGGGLHKMEPGELGNIPAGDVLALLPHAVLLI